MGSSGGAAEGNYLCGVEATDLNGNNGHSATCCRAGSVSNSLLYDTTPRRASVATNRLWRVAARA